MRSATKLGLAAGMAVLAGSPAAAGAPADLGPYEQFQFRYTSIEPGTATGFRYRVRLATQGAEQPPTVRQLRLTFHRGTVVDTRAIARCTATDDEIGTAGVAACPPASRVASGRAAVFVGLVEPLQLDASVFNTATGLAAVLTNEAGGVVRTLRGRLAANRRRFVVPVPAVPLGEGREAALVRFALDIRSAGTARRPWIRTPRHCPKGGWTTTYAPRFDTLGRVTLRDRTRCRRD